MSLTALMVACFLPGTFGMILHATLCPHCHRSEAVVKHGTNRGGTLRCRCKDCHKTFTPQPNPRQTSEATKAAIERALAERLSQRAIARLLRVGDQTIRKVAKEAQKNSAPLLRS
jgi:transposase-like protein